MLKNYTTSFTKNLKGNKGIAAVLAGVIITLTTLSVVVSTLVTQQEQDIRNQAASTCYNGQVEVRRKVCSGDNSRSCETVVIDGVVFEGDINCSVWGAGSCVDASVCECPSSAPTFCGEQGSCAASCRDTGGLGCQDWLNANCGGTPLPTDIPGGGGNPGDPPPPTISTCNDPSPAKVTGIFPSGRIPSGNYTSQWEPSSNATSYNIFFDDLKNIWSDCKDGDTCLENFTSTTLGMAYYPPGKAWDFYVIAENACGVTSETTKVTVAVESLSCNAYCTINENCAHLGDFVCHNNACRDAACVNSNTCSCNTCTAKPATPNMTWPYNGVVPTSGNRVIRWDAVEGATNYRLRINNTSDPWKDTDGSCTAVNSIDRCLNTVDGNGYESTEDKKTWSGYSFESGETYDIWLEAQNGCGISAPTETINFTVGSVPTLTPTPTLVVSTTTPSHTPTSNSCNGITISFGPEDEPIRNPKIGENIILRCGEIAGTYRYQFRILQENTVVATFDANALNSRTSVPYPLTTVGQFTAQCRSCSNVSEDSCQSWE